jgi:hypothetical protein
MTHALIKTGAALLVLGGFAVPALAATPLPLQKVPALVIPVQDEENAEVWHDLRPDVSPPEAAVGKEGEKAMEAAPEEADEKGSGNAEEKALEEDGLGPE